MPFNATLFELFEDGNKAVEIVENGDWVDEGKYSYKETVVKYQDTYYMISESRSGSYFTDYHYDDPEICQVMPRTETIVKTFWDVVK